MVSWRIYWRAVIGSLLVSNEVEIWCKCIQHLCDAAIDESQALFIALVRLRCNLNGIIYIIYIYIYIYPMSILECGTLFATL